MKGPIYRPNGKALEYAELALNLYNGCPHGCVYCYARCIARKTPEQFRTYKPREGIIEALKEQLQNADYAGKLIHLCFNCDPFPYKGDHEMTLEAIRLIHEAGAFVQVLTKGAPGDALFEALGSGDKFGVTVTCLDGQKQLQIEPYAAPTLARLDCLEKAKRAGIVTFISCEPVIDMSLVETLIKYRDDIDEFRIGKLNYNAELERELRAEYFLDRSWGEFGRDIKALCRKHGRKYLIKESLREEME